MRRATRSAARASRTSATCSSWRTPASSGISKPRSRWPITPSIGAGPLEFYADPGKTGLELSALSRINELYAAKGVSRRVGRRRTSVRARAVRQGAVRRLVLQAPRRAGRSHGDDPRPRGEGRHHGPFCRAHLDGASTRPDTGYPTRATVDGWKNLPAPTSDVSASLAKARAGCDELYKALTTWPSWFFARGDLAAGGAGDESPLVFDDTTLKAEPTHPYTYALGARRSRARRARSRAGPVEGVSDLHRRQSRRRA